MKKFMIKMVLVFNISIWIILSFLNYIGIINQFNNDIVRIFLWSIFLIMIYGILIYSITLEINRIMLIFLYRNYKIKFTCNRAVIRQNILLLADMLYVYGVCYYNSIFVGLLPMLIFFGGPLINIGRFYVYDKEHLIMMEDISKEYHVISFDESESKLTFQSVNSESNAVMEAVYKMDSREIDFLARFFKDDFDKMQIA